MIGIIILIFLTVRIYRTAKETGRNAVGWTATAIGIYIGIQIFIVFGLLLILAAGGYLWDWRIHSLDNFAIPIIFLSEILGLVGAWIVANYVSNEPEDKTAFQPPPPAPPQF